MTTFALNERSEHISKGNNLLLKNLLEISKGVKANQSSVDNVRIKLSMETKYLGLTANSNYQEVLNGRPDRLKDENEKIVNKIIRLPGTFSMRDLKLEYK